MIVVLDRQSRLTLHPEKIQRLSASILRDQKIKAEEVTLVFVDARQMKAMNLKFLRHRYETDVLAFDFTGQTRSGYAKNAARPKESQKRQPLWGDVVISTDAIVKNCRRFQSAPEQELLLYIVHGLLHLLGYNDHTSSEIRKMRAKEQELTQRWGRQAKSLMVPEKR